MGRLLRRDPAALNVGELAQALRAPVSMLGDTLRRQPAGSLTWSQARVLSQLSAGDAVTMSSLAQSHGLAISTMTELAARLEEAGFVERAVAADDRREIRVSITKAGQRKLNAVLEVRTETLARRLEELDADDRVKLAAALPALWRLAALDPEIWPRLPDRT